MLYKYINNGFFSIIHVYDDDEDDKYAMYTPNTKLCLRHLNSHLHTIIIWLVYYCFIHRSIHPSIYLSLPYK